MSSSLWSAGRYEAVAEQISVIATAVVAATDRRRTLRDATVVDLACGTGSAALAAARLGAQVTAVDITADLIEIGARVAAAEKLTVHWLTGDAADTGLPAAAFDAAVSNMGIIFVEPQRQAAELARLIKPTGVLGFSSWVRDSVNPLFDPIVRVLGAPPSSGHRPDEWGQPEITTERLSADFEDFDFAPAKLTWRFESQAGALAFVTQESPMHVDIFGRVEAAQRESLLAAFREALAEHLDSDGTVSFDASYVVVTAVRR